MRCKYKTCGKEIKPYILNGMCKDCAKEWLKNDFSFIDNQRLILTIKQLEKRIEELEKMECKYCGYKTDDKNDMRNHMIVAHNKELIEKKMGVDADDYKWIQAFKKLHYLKTDEEAIKKLINIHKAWNKKLFG